MEKRENQKTKSRWLLRLGGIGALLLSFGSKLKSILPLFKLGKFGGTLISMFITVGVYAIVYPFQFAVGLVIMIFIHEMGHVLAAKLRRLPVSAPAFIPFVGALITMKRTPSDAETEAFIAFGGPLLGTVGALVSFGLGVWLDMEIFIVLAWVGFLINLINLIPIHPLDGGRIAVAISRWLWIIGLVGGLILIIYLRSILFLLIYLLFIWELRQMFIGKKKKGIPVTFHEEARVKKSRFTEAGLFIPGEEHVRELLFRQYSDIQEKTTYVEVEFPGIGSIAKFPFNGRVERVTLIRTEDQNPVDEEVRMTLKVEGVNVGAIGGIQYEEEYYQVKPLIRWIYAFLYIGLVAILGYMTYYLGTTYMQ